ncbi:hypothetical protein [Streptococcus sp. sy018]|uniref:hypothetical protein n=1 Tax=Streptococcus sp. sy018 TaxID=2600147 RepID=UPI0011B74AC0|nr:hypothetical protein [Streptococcus sp. sy018]TWS95564.1 hypothetical protein FRX52_01830 [Streptococcus sp. sy018]
MSIIYSHHHFILPFVIKGKFNINNKHWQEVRAVEELPYIKNSTIAYAYQRYFNKESLEIVIDNRELVKNYVYKNPENYQTYRISYYDDSNHLQYFDLDLDYLLIRHHPKLDAAFLIISAKNTQYAEIEQCQRINQYGRRIYNPFQTSDIGRYDFLEAPNDLELLTDKTSLPQHSGNLDTYKIMSAPLQILQDFTQLPEDRIFPEKKISNAQTWLDIIIDDRMFVHTFYESKELGPLIEQTGNSKELEKDQLKTLYNLAFIDNPGSPTCQSEKLLRSTLTQTIYSRWSDYHSLYLVTQHSFLYLSGSDNTPSFLIDYFNSEYLDLLLITLSQRVGLLQYSQKAGEKVSSKSRSILKLQEAFVTFKNQFLLPEVSAQEQAVDLYYYLQNNLYIEKYNNILNEQISSLKDITQTKTENNINSILLWYSIATIFLPLPIWDGKLNISLIIRLMILAVLFIAYYFLKSKKR